jgi:hypothetical protein
MSEAWQVTLEVSAPEGGRFTTPMRDAWVGQLITIDGRPARIVAADIYYGGSSMKVAVEADLVVDFRFSAVIAGWLDSLEGEAVADE